MEHSLKKGLITTVTFTRFILMEITPNAIKRKNHISKVDNVFSANLKKTEYYYNYYAYIIVE